MTNRMLIDADHPEETRVVVLKKGRVEEFDYETLLRRQLRGNIYLAKVTRVEPSLQAAFVDYGGNRHGFLAFSEIHPDYYQIPVADREALLAEEAAEERDEEQQLDEKAERAEKKDNKSDKKSKALKAEGDPEVSEKADLNTSSDDADEEPTDHLSADLNVEEISTEDTQEDIEEAGNEDALEELPKRRVRRRKYKIQEVIKRNQIILIQVVKEERGNKGAALTTYISLAGRYTVLMPNTGRGGGISRKISNGQDRKRLREIVDDLAVQNGMGLIVRTAGASRTKTEIKRDYEYLLRLWESVRNLTLRSTAPALVYEEGNLIKRSIRDLYSKDIDEVFVAGNDSYKEAKAFMRMLMPSHAKNVQPFKENEPIFSYYKIEQQLNNMYSPQVTLKSGGYIVINQTEALVAIDVNSGRATRGFSIEETALKTNKEAAEEVARQLRLRDLAGLVVIDFIDMEERRNNRSVERTLKDALKNDRARIQLGRISLFGLLEMSRQRLRSGVMEGTTSICPHCQGSGIVRSIESLSLNILRAVEDFLQTAKRPSDVTVKTRSEVALYVLNAKRSYVSEMENRHGVIINFDQDNAIEGANYKISPTPGGRISVKPKKNKFVVQPDTNTDDLKDVMEEMEETSEGDEEQTERKPRSKGRRSRGRGRSQRRPRKRDAQTDNEAENESSEENANSEEQPKGEKRRPSRARNLRRRTRRGGRKHDRSSETNSEQQAEAEQKAPAKRDTKTAETKAKPAEKKSTTIAKEKTAKGSASVKKASDDKAKAKKTEPKKAKSDKPKLRVAASTEGLKKSASTIKESSETKADAPKKRGWWQKG